LAQKQQQEKQLQQRQRLAQQQQQQKQAEQLRMSEQRQQQQKIFLQKEAESKALR
jgi:hypothetical protein